MHIPQLAGTRFPVPNSSFELCTVPLNPWMLPSLSLHEWWVGIHIYSVTRFSTVIVAPLSNLWPEGVLVPPNTHRIPLKTNVHLSVTVSTVNIIKHTMCQNKCTSFSQQILLQSTVNIIKHYVPKQMYIFQSMDFTSVNCKYHKTLCVKTNVKQLQQSVKECWVETPPSFHWISQGYWLKQIWYHRCGLGTVGWINSHIP